MAFGIVSLALLSMAIAVGVALLWGVAKLLHLGVRAAGRPGRSRTVTVQRYEEVLALLTEERQLRLQAVENYRTVDVMAATAHVEIARLQRVVERLEAQVAAADPAEVQRLRGQLARLQAELAGEDKTDGSGPFLRAKRRFAAIFHPDRIDPADPSRGMREAAFKLFWPELEDIGRRG